MFGVGQLANDLITIQERLRAQRPDPHYQDVYHVATYILFVPLVTYSPRKVDSEEPSQHPYVHRGQRNINWPVTPISFW